MEQEFTWQGIAISLKHVANWLNTGHDHIELRASERLPVTETGYRSHFIRPEELALFDSPLDFVQQWLDTMAQEKAWQTYLKDSQQLSLF
jgi:hypothetical protein